MTALTTRSASGGYAGGMTAAAGTGLVLVAAVAALTALIARAHRLRQRPDEGRGAGSPPSGAASVSGGSNPGAALDNRLTHPAWCAAGGQASR